MSHKQTWGGVLCIPTFHNCCIRHWRQKQDAKYVKTIDPLIGIAIASSDYCVLTARSVAIRIGSILFCLYFTFNFYRLEVYVGVSSVSFLRLVARVSNQIRGGRAWESAGLMYVYRSGTRRARPGRLSVASQDSSSSCLPRRWAKPVEAIFGLLQN